VILTQTSARFTLPTLRNEGRNEGPSQLPTCLFPTLQPSNLPTCKLLSPVTPYRSQPYKCPLPQPLSFDNHTNAPGGGGASNNSTFKRSTFRCPAFLSNHLRTLLLFRGRGGYARSFALFCRSLHQVCFTTLLQSSASALFLKTAGVSPNNSHFGSPRVSRGTRRPPLPPSQPSTFKPSNVQTALCPTSHLSERRASDVLLARTCLSDKLSSGHHSVRSFCVGGCDG